MRLSLSSLFLLTLLGFASCGKIEKDAPQVEKVSFLEDVDWFYGQLFNILDRRQAVETLGPSDRMVSTVAGKAPRSDS